MTLANLSRLENPVQRRSYLDVRPSDRVRWVFHPQTIPHQPLLAQPELEQTVAIGYVGGLPGQMRRIRRPSDRGIVRWTAVAVVHHHRPTPVVPDALEGIQKLLAHYPRARAAVLTKKLTHFEVGCVRRHAQLPKKMARQSARPSAREVVSLTNGSAFYAITGQVQERPREGNRWRCHAALDIGGARRDFSGKFKP